MTRKNTGSTAAIDPIELELQRVQSLGGDGLRSAWRETFKKDVPSALTRDLLVRMMAWHIQEQVFGGHDRATLKILVGYAKGAPGGAQRRYLKPGTEIVREYQGERHTVVVTKDGFRWRGGEYPSLTAIARTITGTSCNGPRFFGLRIGGESDSVRATQLVGAGRQSPVMGKKAEEARP